MEASFQSGVTPLASPWRTFLLKELGNVQEQLWIICPYIKTEIISALREVLCVSPAASQQQLEVRLLTRIEPEELLSGSSDIKALLQFLHWPQDISGCKVTLHAINNVHAKVWLIDSREAIVGSGNATPSGLDENLEYGLAVSDPALVAQITNDWKTWWQQSAPVTIEQLEQMQSWLERAKASFQELEARFATERLQIERLLGPSPHLATRLSPQNKKASQERPSHLAEEAQAYRSSPPVATFTCSAPVFWQALNWVAPQIDEWQRMYATHSPFVRLSWQSIPEPTLQCTWADGRRISQARVPCVGDESQFPWALTLDLQHTKMLSDGLLAHCTSSIEGNTITCQLFKQGTAYELVFAGGHNVSSAGVSSILSGPPSAFPTLRPPVSRFTVEHSSLITLLTSLKQYDLSSTILRIRLRSSEGSIQVYYEVEPVVSASTLLLPTTDAVLIGPSITLRLHYSTLRFVMQQAPATITTWQFVIDRDANVVQIVPGTENQVLQTWRHQIRHEQ